MSSRSTLAIAAVSAAAMVTAMACRGETWGPTAPSASARAASPQASLLVAPGGETLGPAAIITFPPRNEPDDFRRNRLEVKYRDGLRRNLTQTFVDPLGSGVWIQEYLRYRVNRCGHLDAQSRVFTVIDTQSRTIPAVCGEAPDGEVIFPPRNEPRDFRVALEVKYRDDLRSPLSQTFVDLEGDVIWMQEYIRYRLNGCSHTQASDRTLQIVDTPSMIPPVCVDTPPPPPPPANVVARITGAPSGVVTGGTPISVSGLTSTSNRGLIRTYEWTCSDPPAQGQIQGCTSTSATPSFRYPRTGPSGTTVSHNLRLTVTDVEGNRASAVVVVRVAQEY